MEWLRSQGAYVVKVHGGPFQEAGVSDLLVCWRGRFIAIEIKTPTGKLTEIQQHHLEQVLAAGGIGVVARSVQHLKTSLLLYGVSFNES